MQESIGGVQLFAIVITIILLFSGIMAITLNRSNAFAVKDQIVQIIEKHDGFDFSKASKCAGGNAKCYEVLDEIKTLLVKESYRSKGICKEYDGAITVKGYQRDGKPSTSRQSSAFCIAKIPAQGNIGGYYYRIEVFYHLDIPILKQVFNLKVTGETKRLYS